jgi:uncharacterized damage-inducible protein DinB
MEENMMNLTEAPWKIYLDEAAPADPVARFLAHAQSIRVFLESIPLERSDERYAPEKWSVKQVIGHITDANLIFLYRLVCIARGESKSLPGFDENEYVNQGQFESARWENMLAAHRSIADATAALIQGLDGETWNRRGSANGVDITPLEMLRVMMGHERHHIQVLKDRYGLG